MRVLEYAVRRAAVSFWRRRRSSLVAVLAIALATVVLGALLVVTWNVERILARWTAGAELSVFLRDDATSEQRGVLEALLDQSGATSGREYVSKEQAMARFRADFEDLASLTQGFDDNPFPASLEVRVDPAAERDGRAGQLFRRVATLPGVSDVRYDRQWIARVGTGLDAIRGIGLLVALLMAMAAAVTVASVVRLSLDAQQQEIEIMQLVGAPMGFIRGPFIVEGVLAGGLGALVSLVGLWLGFRMVMASWGPRLTDALEGVSPVFLPWTLTVALVLGGMVLGAAGGFVASRNAD